MSRPYAARRLNASRGTSKNRCRTISLTNTFMLMVISSSASSQFTRTNSSCPRMLADFPVTQESLCAPLEIAPAIAVNLVANRALQGVFHSCGYAPRELNTVSPSVSTSIGPQWRQSERNIVRMSWPNRRLLKVRCIEQLNITYKFPSIPRNNFMLTRHNLPPRNPWQRIKRY